MPPPVSTIPINAMTRPRRTAAHFDFIAHLPRIGTSAATGKWRRPRRAQLQNETGVLLFLRLVVQTRQECSEFSIVQHRHGAIVPVGLSPD
jgi:hypothetical protein